jgi:UPF0755 protein
MARSLSEKEVISNPLFFELWARLLNYQKRIQPGEYLFSTHERPIRVLRAMVSGEGRVERVTIPEGLRAFEIANLLESKGICSSQAFMELVSSPSFIRELGLEARTLEGYLFPDTYRFVKSMDPKAVIRAFVKTFFSKVLGHIPDDQGQNQRLHEILTLASIVERESRDPQEKRIVAGVFLNRLRLGMKLESDPTVGYGLNGPLRSIT